MKKPQRESISEQGMSDGEMDEEKFREESEPPEDFPKAVATMEEEDSPSKKDFECDQCGKTYGTRASLRTHLYNHSKKLRDENAAAAVKAERFEDRDKDDSVLSETEDGVVALLDTTMGDNGELEEKIDSLVEKRDGMWTCMQCGKFDNSRYVLLDLNSFSQQLTC